MEVRQRLCAPIHAAVRETVDIRVPHSVPIGQRVWRYYSDGLTDNVERLIDSAGNFPPVGSGYHDLRKWIDGLLATRSAIENHFSMLNPFEPFEPEIAMEIIAEVEEFLSLAAASIEAGIAAPVSGARLAKTLRMWPREAGIEFDQVAARAFGLDSSPIDEVGEFKPTWIFEAYAYNNGQLIERIAGHLSSLGLPFTFDALAGVWVVGSIVSSPDPVVAFAALHAMLNSFLNAQDRSVVREIMAHIRERDQSSRQSRRRILATSVGVDWSSPDIEQDALKLADIYKRLVEGPVRQHGWALLCLRSGSWSHPPTLNRIGEALVADGGFGQLMADAAIIVDLRNGEAHEDLHWDGYKSVYVANGTEIPILRVRHAVSTALSFGAGCDAAVAFYRAISGPIDRSLPSADDKYRMSPWQRAEVFFGTNGLRLVDARLNSTTAHIELEALTEIQINPCFQALVCLRRLLPRIRHFRVYTVENRETDSIHLDASGLDETFPVWSFAIESFTRMPLAAFLPANFSARRQSESEMVAVRAICWIAVDDALDALDSVEGVLDNDALVLLTRRLELVAVAVSQTQNLVTEGSRTRARLVLESIAMLRSSLCSMLDGSVGYEQIDDLGSVGRLRHYWSAWGPVVRLPTVSPETDREDTEPEPRLRGEFNKFQWMTT